MCLALMQLTPAPRAGKDEIEQWAESYLCSMRQNGQVVGNEWSFAWRQGILNYYVELPRPDAFENHYNSEWVQHPIDELMKYLDGPLTWSIIEDLAPKRFPSLKSSSFLYLSSHGDLASPVHRGNDGVGIPLYLIPINQVMRQDIRIWTEYDETFTSLWFKSGIFEIPAWRQMCEPNSVHARDGRKLSKEIEKASGIPSYYYLDRYYGRPEGEDDRPCPVCGKSWRIAKRWPKQKKFWDFEFKCEPCRLVSHVALPCDDERDEKLATIGEYKKRS